MAEILVYVLRAISVLVLVAAPVVGLMRGSDVSHLADSLRFSNPALAATLSPVSVGLTIAAALAGVAVTTWWAAEVIALLDGIRKRLDQAPV